MRIALLLVLGLFTQSIWGQWSETGGWLGVEVDQELRNDWAWSLQWENRWDTDLSRHQRGILDASIEKNLFSRITANVQYRYSEERNRTGGYTPRQRLALRLSSEGQWGIGKWNARLMGSQSLGPSIRANDTPWMEVDESVRFRFGYQHDWTGLWRWKTDIELFPDFETFADQKTRFRWLFTRQVNQALSASIGYIWSQQWNAVDPQTQHILKTNLSWTLDRPKKRKKSKTKIPSALVMVAEQGNQVAPVVPPVCTSEAAYVSEVHAKGQPADWIVITNRSESWCTLKGWRLTDSLEKSGLEFDAIVLPPQGKWKGYEKGQGSFDFGISADGERLFWIHPQGQIQEIQVGPQQGKGAQSIDLLGRSMPAGWPEKD